MTNMSWTSESFITPPPVQVRKLSTLPFLICIVIDVLSLLLGIRVLMLVKTDNALWLAVVGYLLTPFLAVGALLWARAMHVKNQGVPGYLQADGRSKVKVVGLVAALSFIPALIHIYYLANFIGASR
jgi:hypothetical protein